MCVRACVSACVRACVCMHVCVCARASDWVCVRVCLMCLCPCTFRVGGVNVTTVQGGLYYINIPTEGVLFFFSFSFVCVCVCVCGGGVCVRAHRNST